MNILDMLRSRGLQPIHVSAAKGGEYASPCPGCGGKDRFHCWPEQSGGPLCQDSGVTGTYWCRACGSGGDMLQYLQDFEGATFSAACRELGADPKAKRPTSGRLPQPPRPAATAYAPAQLAVPSDTWRARAARLVERAHERLLRAPTPLAWLAKRGLDLDAVRRYRLGYLEEEGGKRGIIRPVSAWGLELLEKQLADGTRVKKNTFWIPRGITIPAYGPDGPDAPPIRVRIRRPDGDLEGKPGGFGDKYMVIRGSGMAPMLLGASSRAFVVVEAELDAMLVHHLAGGLPRGGVGALAVLTNLGKPDAQAHAALTRAYSVLVALDYDKAGANGWAGPDPSKGPRPDGWAGWPRIYRQARRWPTPEGKDPGDAYALGVDLRAWVMAGLPPVYHLREERPADAQVGVSPACPAAVAGGGDQPQPSAPSTTSTLSAPSAEQLRAMRGLALFMRRKGVTYAAGPDGARAWALPDGLSRGDEEDLWSELLRLCPGNLLPFISAHPSPTVTADNLCAPYHH